MSHLLLSIPLALVLGACSNQGAAPPPVASETAVVAPSATETRAPSSSATPPSGILRLPTSAASAGPSATPLAQQQLDRLVLSSTDLPAGFVVTGSGPGGPELGRDVLTSYQQEFQQRDVTSTQSLQQTIVIIDLLGQYRDAGSALSGIRAVNVQSLNQLLGSVNLTAEPASIPAIEDDSAGFHFSGDTNGTAVGGYLVVFHRGPIASLILTASVKGAESLPQTVDLAQKQAQRIHSAG